MTGNDRRNVVFILPSSDGSIQSYDRRHVLWIYPFTQIVPPDPDTGRSPSLTSNPNDEVAFITGELAIDNRFVPSCWKDLTNPWRFIKRLQQALKVVFTFPSGYEFINHGFPTPKITPFKMWGRLDGNLNPLGWYSFIKGFWRKFYTDMTSASSMRWIMGDSDDPPEGWQPILTGTTGINPAVVESLVEQYVEISPGRYSYYAARYIGYQ